MTNTNKGYDINTGLYTTRYYARKAATGETLLSRFAAAIPS